MSKNKIGLILTALNISSVASAVPEKLVPDSSFHVGLEGSYNSTTINQELSLWHFHSK